MGTNPFFFITSLSSGNFQPMKYHLFPETDLSVSQLCFGCWGIISDLHWGTREKEVSVQAILAAVDSGINFFDTAPMYGDGASEDLLGKVFAENGLRQKVVIGSKIRPDKMSPADVKKECEESLTRLQTEYLDLYQTHWTSPDVPIAETLGAMQELQQQGKVRHLGVCNAGVIDLNDVVSVQKPLTNQLPYNLLSRMIEFEIQPRCVEQQIGILVYSPLMHAMLADKYKTAADVPDGRARTRHFSTDRANARHGEPGCEAETFAAIDRIREIASVADRSMAEIALAWTIAQPGVVSVIAGAGNAQQVRQNAKFLEHPISAETIAELNIATDVVKEKLGKNPDLWVGGTNSRYH
jgi:aryl-alcohol dehydrogenase-like predicted oxidoreductase